MTAIGSMVLQSIIWHLQAVGRCRELLNHDSTESEKDSLSTLDRQAQPMLALARRRSHSDLARGGTGVLRD